MRNFSKYLGALLVILTVASPVRAETVYVSDQVVISLREGKSSQDKVIKPIRTGTPMEVLERDEDKVHVKVRLESGEQGYVPAQYLSSETPKLVVIARLEQEVQRLRTQQGQAAPGGTGGSAPPPEADETAAGCGALTEKLSTQARALAQAHDNLQAITEKYNSLLAKSEQIVEITAERDRLRQASDTADSELQALRAENASLRRTSGIKWFLAGGGVLFCGWLIGGASRRRRTSSRLLD